jgi:hypothetical protein
MREIVTDYLPWVLSAITIWQTMLAGNKHRHTWSMLILNQALWLVWIVVVGAWGLLPMNLALWVVGIRNHMKWRTT